MTEPAVKKTGKAGKFGVGDPGGPGRPPGSVNKTTKAAMLARGAIARLVDDNAGRMQEWLDEIAKTEGPLVAFKCLTDVLEYHIPKLARSEVTGLDGGPVPIAVKVEFVNVATILGD